MSYSENHYLAFSTKMKYKKALLPIYYVFDRVLEKMTDLAALSEYLSGVPSTISVTVTVLS